MQRLVLVVRTVRLIKFYSNLNFDHYRKLPRGFDGNQTLMEAGTAGKSGLEQILHELN